MALKLQNQIKMDALRLQLVLVLLVEWQKHGREVHATLLAGWQKVALEVVESRYVLRLKATTTKKAPEKTKSN